MSEANNDRRTINTMPGDNDLNNCLQMSSFESKTTSEAPLSMQHQEPVLNNTWQYELQLSTSTQVTIYEFLGRPKCKAAIFLSDQECEKELLLMEKRLKEKGIILLIRGSYSHKVIYRFITEELFIFPTEDVHIPGYLRTYIFEDYHPNHNLAIQHAVKRFLELWLQRNLKTLDTELTQVFVTNKGIVKTKYEVLRKINATFQNYTDFENGSFYFSQNNFHWDKEDDSGTGHAEGYISYDAINHAGEIMNYSGMFKFYLSHEENGWEIFYFILPGFSWSI